MLNRADFSSTQGNIVLKLKQTKTQNHLLGIFSFVKQLFDFIGVLCGLIDNPLNVADVVKAVLYLHDHLVQSGPVEWQCDRQDLQSHFLYAPWIGALLWAEPDRTGNSVNVVDQHTNKNETISK